MFNLIIYLRQTANVAKVSLGGGGLRVMLFEVTTWMKLTYELPNLQIKTKPRQPANMQLVP